MCVASLTKREIDIVAGGSGQNETNSGFIGQNFVCLGTANTIAASSKYLTESPGAACVTWTTSFIGCEAVLMYEAYNRSKNNSCIPQIIFSLVSSAGAIYLTYRLLARLFAHQHVN